MMQLSGPRPGRLALTLRRRCAAATRTRMGAAMHIAAKGRYQASLPDNGGCSEI